MLIFKSSKYLTWQLPPDSPPVPQSGLHTPFGQIRVIKIESGRLGPGFTSKKYDSDNLALLIYRETLYSRGWLIPGRIWKTPRPHPLGTARKWLDDDTWQVLWCYSRLRGKDIVLTYCTVSAMGKIVISEKRSQLERRKWGGIFIRTGTVTTGCRYGLRNGMLNQFLFGFHVSTQLISMETRQIYLLKI